MTNKEKTLKSIELATGKANTDEWLVTLLSSIAISLAIIADHTKSNGTPLEEALENQKTGHWIIDINDKDYCFCQFCRHKFDVDYLRMVWGTYEFPPHCPNCGAELKGE